jgi:NitT/TauT family transport system permease protein
MNAKAQIKRSLPAVILGAILIAFWQTSCVVFSIPQFLLPTPLSIAQEIAANHRDLLFNTWITCQEAALGFLIANILALALAVCMVYIKNLDKAVMPIAIALKTTPIVAMAPLLLLWFGTGMLPKIMAAALICFFPVLVNSIKGFNALLENEEDLFRIYSASKTQLLLKLRFFRAAPFIFSALRISSSLAIVGAIIGEFVGANHGIGYVILVSSYHLETVRMFAALVMAAVAGVVFYGIISLFDRKILTWVQASPDEIRLESPPKMPAGRGLK